MDPFAPMASQLQTRPPVLQHPTKHDGITDRIRQHLRDNGQCTARELAKLVGLASSGKISAILKKDRRAGRVILVDGLYSWNDVQPQPPCDGRTRVRDVLDWHEVAEDDFPDADMTVIVRIRGAAEPVWLGVWDGEEWRDVEGLTIDVVRWADLPEGGEA